MAEYRRVYSDLTKREADSRQKALKIGKYTVRRRKDPNGRYELWAK